MWRESGRGEKDDEGENHHSCILAGYDRAAGKELLTMGCAATAGGRSGETTIDAERHRVASWESVRIDSMEWHATAGPDDESGAERDRVATMTIGGRVYRVDFPSAASRRMSLRTMADWVVRPRILKVTGVAEVFLLGGGVASGPVEDDVSRAEERFVFREMEHVPRGFAGGRIVGGSQVGTSGIEGSEAVDDTFVTVDERHGQRVVVEG